MILFLRTIRGKIVFMVATIILFFGAAAISFIVLGCTTDLWSFFNIINFGDLENTMEFENRSTNIYSTDNYNIQLTTPMVAPSAQPPTQTTEQPISAISTTAETMTTVTPIPDTPTTVKPTPETTTTVTSTPDTPTMVKPTSETTTTVKPTNINNSNASIIILGDSSEGLDKDSNAREKRDFIKKMMKDAWDNYVKYAWGANELQPVSLQGRPSSLEDKSLIGTTIVESMDSLFIMGLKSEYKQGRQWISRKLKFPHKEEVSLFETTIRYLGGLLATYALTGDTVFKSKAYKLGKKLLPAFNTSSGIPLALVDLESGVSKNYRWVSEKSSILSEFGTLHLEFVYLSDITGDPIFKEKVLKIRQVLQNVHKPQGLYSNFVNPKTGNFSRDKAVSMGAFGDSFYEYLLKSYIQTGDNEGRVMYDEAMDAFDKNGFIRKSKGGLLYFARMDGEEVHNTMQHLACFSGAMFALGSTTDPKLKVKPANKKRSRRHMEIAKGITNTCHESYIRTPTHLGPENFRFDEDAEAVGGPENVYYILRPEVIESYFIMWRVTGDKKYREWGWDAAQAIEKYCKAGPTGGYSGLKSVYSDKPEQDDVQQTFFLAETLKFLYLLFSSEELIDLKYWVFNTEGHPLPIKGVNPYYRESKEKST